MVDRKERRDRAIFFIYDHNLLKKEEDDLIDAILYFSPEDVSDDDQCALCGQLMGMAEFLHATLGKSSPRIFKFEHEKYAIKRVGAYSLCLQCKKNEPDFVVFKQLDDLYGTFVTFHGSLNSLRLRCKDNNNNFLQDLGNIWQTILNISGTSLQPNISKTFHHLPYIQLPKIMMTFHDGLVMSSHPVMSALTMEFVMLIQAVYIKHTGSHLYLQASHLLQSSQRRPYVLGGAILYKNEVVCTQLTPTLTRQLTYLQVQMPYIEKKMDFELPVGCKICTMFLTDDELLHVCPLEPQSRRHCKMTDFSSRQDSEVPYRDNYKYTQTKLLTRRQTCPNISSSLALFEHHDHATAGSEGAGNSLLGMDRTGTFKRTANLVGVDRQIWGKSRTKVSLSHVPIVECRSGESPVESDMDTLINSADESYFGKSYRSSFMNDLYRFEPLKTDINDVSDNESDNDFQFSESDRYLDDDKSKSQNTDTCSDDKELNLSNNQKAVGYNEQVVNEKLENGEHNASNTNVDIETLKADDIDSTLLKNEDSNLPEKLQNETEKSSQSSLQQNKANTASIQECEIEAAHKKGIYVEQSDSSEISAHKNGEILLETDLTEKVKSDTQTDANSQNVNDAEDKSGTTPDTSDNEVACRDGEEFQTSETNEIKVVKTENIDSEMTEHNDDNHITISVKEPVHINGSLERPDEEIPSVSEEKENVDPANINEIHIINGYKKTIKTKSKTDGLKDSDVNAHSGNMDEPCINCLELRSENPKSVQDRCPQCLSKRKSHIINHFGDRKEVIAFTEREGAGADSLPSHMLDTEIDSAIQSVISAESAFSSDVSTDSTISRFWTHEMDGLNDVTLYIQCHSDISLLLLMENPEQYQENLLHSLWKGSLHYLADLDFYIKESLEQKDAVPAEHFNFTQFNKFSRDLKENVQELSSKKKVAFSQIMATLHSEFEYHPSMVDVTLRGQASSCYGHRNQVNETFFQLDGPQRLVSGLPLPKEPNYMLDTVARSKLAKDRHISLM